MSELVVGKITLPNGEITDVADQAEAEAGTDNSKLMTPLRTAQAIAELSPAPSELTQTQVEDDTSTVFGTVSGQRLAQSFDAREQQIGVGQVPIDVLASRSANTTYQNTTGRPIALSIRPSAAGGNRNTQVSADGVNWVTYMVSGGAEAYGQFSIVPAGWFYRFTGAFGLWVELR